MPTERIIVHVESNKIAQYRQFRWQRTTNSVIVYRYHLQLNQETNFCGDSTAQTIIEEGEDCNLTVVITKNSLETALVLSRPCTFVAFC